MLRTHSFHKYEIHGRGAGFNPENRFDTLQKQEADPEFLEWLHQNDEFSKLKTELFSDSTKKILSKNDSPDINFTYSLNPYRGCEHGCVYCYARPSHEYLGFSAGLDFESKIVVKYQAAKLLREALSHRRWQPQTVVMSGVTDPYQPVERQLQITRACLKVFNEFKNPVAIITKNSMIERDLDLLKQLASVKAVQVFVSITTLDFKLARILEPRASTPQQRLEAIKVLSEAGIPCGVMVAPIIPAINEHEIPAILQAAAQAGAKNAGYTLLRLPYANKDIFVDWLEKYFPDRKNRVLHHLEDLRDGKMYESDFGLRMRGKGEYAEQIKTFFRMGKKRAQMTESFLDLSTQAFKAPGQQAFAF